VKGVQGLGVCVPEIAPEWSGVPCLDLTKWVTRELAGPFGGESSLSFSLHHWRCLQSSHVTFRSPMDCACHPFTDSNAGPLFDANR
jgi:hypothetical protein